MKVGWGYSKVEFTKQADGTWMSDNKPPIVPEWLERIGPKHFKQVATPPNVTFSTIREWPNPTT